MFCEVITDLGVNGQPPYSTEREMREEAEIDSYLALLVAVRQGQRKNNDSDKDDANKYASYKDVDND